MPSTLTEEAKAEIVKAGVEAATEAITAALNKAAANTEDETPPGGGANGKKPSKEANAAGGDAGEAKKAAKKAAKRAARAAKAVAKGDDSELRKQLQKAEADRTAMAAQLASAQAEAHEASQIAKAERDARVTRDFIAKAEALDALPIQSDSFGSLLKSASERLSKDEYEQLVATLTSANEVVRQGDLFREVGSSVAKASPSSALGEVMEKAETLRKADSGLSTEQAMERVMTSDRELQARYLQEVRGA